MSEKWKSELTVRVFAYPIEWLESCSDSHRSPNEDLFGTRWLARPRVRRDGCIETRWGHNCALARRKARRATCSSPRGRAISIATKNTAGSHESRLVYITEFEHRSWADGAPTEPLVFLIATRLAFLHPSQKLVWSARFAANKQIGRVRRLAAHQSSRQSHKQRATESIAL